MRIILFSFIMAFSQAIMFDVLYFRQKHKVKKSIVHLNVINFFVFLISGFVKLYFQDKQDIISSCIILIAFIMLYFIHKWIGFQKDDFIAVLCSMILLGALGDLITLGIIFCIRGDIKIPNWQKPGEGYGIIMSHVVQLWVVFCLYLYRKRNIFKNKINHTYRNIIIIIVASHNLIILWGVIYLIFQKRKQGLPFLSILIVEELFFIVCLSNIFLKSVKYDEIKLIEHQVLNMEKETQQNYQCYKTLESQYQNLYKLHHDFNNVINTVYSLSVSGNYEKAKLMLNDLNKMLGTG